jgi:hypothetical protein
VNKWAWEQVADGWLGSCRNGRWSAQELWEWQGRYTPTFWHPSVENTNHMTLAVEDVGKAAAQDSGLSE